MIVRPVTEADRPAWLAMRQALWPDADATVMAAELSLYLDPDRTGPALPGFFRAEAAFVVVGADGALTGFVETSIRTYASGCDTDHVGYVEGWYVVPEARLTGVGRALVAAAEGWARAQGCTEMASDVELDNDASHDAHQRLGFAEVERVVLYKKAL